MVGEGAHQLDLTLGEWFDALADRFALPRPPRLSREELMRALPPQRASFLAESRRLRNDRIKRELGVRLCYPDIWTFLDQYVGGC